MPRRSSRLGFLFPAKEVERLRDARTMLTDLRAVYKINSEPYRKAGAALTAIDDVVEELIGDRKHFWARDAGKVK